MWKLQRHKLCRNTEESSALSLSLPPCACKDGVNKLYMLYIVLFISWTWCSLYRVSQSHMSCLSPNSISSTYFRICFISIGHGGQEVERQVRSLVQACVFFSYTLGKLSFSFVDVPEFLQSSINVHQISYSNLPPLYSTRFNSTQLTSPFHTRSTITLCVFSSSPRTVSFSLHLNIYI